jgi:cytochrome c-type biogenesis protein CcmH/NrfF
MHRTAGAIGLALFLGWSVAAAQGAVWSDDTVAGRDSRVASRLYDELMSPYCPGYTLAACPSPSAESLRVEIAAALDRGVPAPDIVRDLERTYGEQIRGAPRARGLGLVLWVLPFVLLGLAAVLVFRRLARPARAAPDMAHGVGASSPSDPQLLARLAAELHSLK